jgi:hypothetical protein
MPSNDPKRRCHKRYGRAGKKRRRDFVSVTVLMGPGVVPLLYKTSAGDVVQAQKTDSSFNQACI